jgi:hypothetical protein
MDVFIQNRKRKYLFISLTEKHDHHDNVLFQKSEEEDEK